jgi:chaperonin GroEL
MAKILAYDAEAKQKILAGVEKLERAVATTLGPCGKNVIINEYGQIHSTRDGVTVAKAVTLKDEFENLGANAIKEVAEKSNIRCGDGTTSSTILASSIYKNGLKYVSFGSNSTQIKNGIKRAADRAVAEIKKLSKSISTKEEIKRVATVSANHDSEIGEIIADVMDKIGKDGTIKVEDGNTMELTSKIMEGMVIDQPYVSPYMVTNTETGEAELDNPWILVANKKLNNIQELLPCLQTVSATKAPLLVIADEIQEDLIATFIVNRLRSGFTTVAVKSPSYGDSRNAILEDIAILCGGRVVSDETGTKLEHATPETGILGRATKVVVTGETTVIIGGAGSKEKIAERAASLRNSIEATNTSDYDREKLQERLAKLTSGIGIISVGATTEAERKEKRDRVDDAFAASKAAVRSGIVPGGGVALLLAKKALATWMLETEFAGDEGIGARILFDSLDAPAKKILENAGEDASLIVGKIGENSSSGYGYNVLTKEFVDMVEDGVVDPAEVVVNEIQNAASVSGLLLTTDCLIVEEPKKINAAAPQMPAPGMM